MAFGNIRGTTDSEGNVIDSYDYDPYGNKIDNNESTFGFKGEQFDPDTGLVYMRARYYDPATGRFISRDPVEGDLNDPITQNGYNYANDNPINLSDPSGRQVAQVVQICAQSAVAGLNLAKALASQQQLGEAGKVIAGGTSGTVFRDAVAIAEQYGGQAINLVKMVSSSYVASDGTMIQTHWVEDLQTGAQILQKTVMTIVP